MGKSVKLNKALIKFLAIFASISMCGLVALAIVDFRPSLINIPFINKETSKVKLFAVGDIMLGRYVETLMLNNGEDYPFTQISTYWAEHDLVLGNLEGPIVAKHVQTADFTTNFSFHPSVALLLKKHGYNLLSLANNHTADKGINGFLETENFLLDAGLTAFGHPTELDNTRIVHQVINKQKITFIGLHDATIRLNDAAAQALINQVRIDNPDNFIIVYIHWGAEYQLTNNQRQQDLAHSFIDSGADAIIGHHPHVVQNIEMYNGKPIFYSLGNFIFDQYFSEDTQEGLALDILIEKRQVNYKLLPISIVRSQPQIMLDEQIANWLVKLAERSQPDLAESIRLGILTQDR